MRLLTNSGVAAGRAYPANNLGAGVNSIYVWGTTVTNVDIEISPDSGTTWIPVQNMTAAGHFQHNLAGGENYQIRANVVAGSGVYVDFF